MQNACTRFLSMALGLWWLLAAAHGHAQTGVDTTSAGSQAAAPACRGSADRVPRQAADASTARIVRATPAAPPPAMPALQCVNVAGLLGTVTPASAPQPKTAPPPDAEEKKAAIEMRRQLLDMRRELLAHASKLATGLGVAAIALALLAALWSTGEGGFRVTSHWGGFGGSGGGWHATPAVASLLAAVVLAFAAAMVVMAAVPLGDIRPDAAVASK